MRGIAADSARLADTATGVYKKRTNKILKHKREGWGIPRISIRGIPAFSSLEEIRDRNRETASLRDDLLVSPF
jgi:hypothetical protein